MELTIKSIRKAMRGLNENGGKMTVPGWGQIQKFGSYYAIGPLPENDETDPMSDYSDWMYGFNEKTILLNIKNRLRIE